MGPIVYGWPRAWVDADCGKLTRVKKLTRIGPGLNAFRLSFADNLLDEIRESYNRELRGVLANPANQRLLAGGRALHQTFGGATSEYYLVTFLSYPLLWLSSNTPRTWQIYKSFFDSLDIEQEVRALVDHDEKIVLYCGFLTIGSHAPEPSWHVDYLPGANAYSLLTPLFELDPAHGDFLYQAGEGLIGTYPYAQGEAIMFGDNFLHCTEPYENTGHLRILITLQFGTDKMEHWKVLRKTIESQSDFLILPCGHQSRTCDCPGQEKDPAGPQTLQDVIR